MTSDAPRHGGEAWQFDEFMEMVDGTGSAAVRAAATLRIADHIAAGVDDLPGLAARTGIGRAVLSRLLAFLTCRGVFGVGPAGHYQLTPLSVTLLDAHSSGLRRWLDADGIGPRMDAAVQDLPRALRTGQPSYPRLHGTDFYTDMTRADVSGRSFDELRGNHAAEFADAVAALDCWNDARTVMDVGGGTGVIAKRLLETHPALRVRLLDLPAAVSIARDRLAGTSVDRRFTATAGSFFDALPATADVLLLVNVLHNWDDNAACRILRRCAAAAADGGRVVVVERLSDNADARSLSAMDLRMFVFCGGRERSLVEFHALAHAAGLTTDHIDELASGLRAIHLRTADRQVAKGTPTDDAELTPTR